MQYIIFRVAVFNRSKGILLWFFDNQDLNDDNYISPYEFMRSKKTILYFPEDETIEDETESETEDSKDEL